MTDNEIRQTFWLTLANAFMPPQRPEVANAFRTMLADDLDELGAAIGIEAWQELADFRHNVGRIRDDQELLVDYSHLFLQPPIPAKLNLGIYVDGALNGPCLDVLENAYRLIGIAKRDTLKDLPDHLVVQMETLAVLFGEAEAAMSPGQFANLCLVGALPRLAVAIGNESPESPYAPLAAIAAKAIAELAEAPDKKTLHRRRHAKRRADTSLGIWRHCKTCGKPFAREKEIGIMAKALSEAGLPTEHLDRCPDCRDVVQGYFNLETAVDRAS
ncbi:MAG: molecular chaperone TorD family protein [Rhodocyclaceae bacterium]